MLKLSRALVARSSTCPSRSPRSSPARRLRSRRGPVSQRSRRSRRPRKPPKRRLNFETLRDGPPSAHPTDLRCLTIKYRQLSFVRHRGSVVTKEGWQARMVSKCLAGPGLESELYIFFSVFVVKLLAVGPRSKDDSSKGESDGQGGQGAQGMESLAV